MEYRTLGRTGLRVSAIGLGGEFLEGKSREQIKDVIDAAIAGGINYLDVFMSEPNVRTDIGLALKGRRDAMYIQGHIGSIFEDGQWTRSRDLKKCIAFFEDLLTRLQTDYIDIGMLHCIDNETEYNQVFDTDILKYALSLKDKGTIHYIGLSTHNPEIVLKAVKSGIVDVIMYSVNAAFDFEQSELELDTLLECHAIREGQYHMNDARQEVYSVCDAENVAIVVMKPFAAGILLDAARSPFGKALTPSACLQYALDRPAVATVVPGCCTIEEVKAALKWLDATDAEKDYSFIFKENPQLKVTGRCMYCGHCKPCAAHIDIPVIGKLLDLALAGESVPETVRGHYDALSATADDCIDCHQCEPNCPFSVNITEMMAKARRVFGH